MLRFREYKPKGGGGMKRIAILIATVAAMVALAVPAFAYHGQELTLTKTIDQSGPIEVGDTVSFTITFTNSPSSGTHFGGLYILDTLPEGFQVTGYGIESDSGSVCSLPSPNTVRCFIPGLFSPGETVTMRVGTVATQLGTFTNTASTNCSDLEAGTGCTYYGGSPSSVTFTVLPLDADDDAVPDEVDNCPLVANPGQTDRDQDGYGDACDAKPNNKNKH
jgi:uncharacterized repeat protein (TIGR01451 family)